MYWYAMSLKHGNIHGENPSPLGCYNTLHYVREIAFRTDSLGHNDAFGCSQLGRGVPRRGWEQRRAVALTAVASDSQLIYFRWWGGKGFIWTHSGAEWLERTHSEACVSPALC